MTSAKKTDPKLWEKVKEEITDSDKGGRPGQWSARKAQMAVQEYKHEGGGFEGGKSEDNSLVQWEKEDWGTKSGEKSGDTGERYLPKKAREELSDEEHRRTTAKKRADTKKGRQFSGQPEDVARKAAKHRDTGKGDGGGKTRAELYAEAKRRGIPGRSGMDKASLERALAS
jgi:hypothetical protein